MKYIFLIFLFSSFLLAHKVNLFTSLENEKVKIYSYFASSKPCKNCKLIIKHGEKIVLQDILDKNGEYTYEPKYKNIEIIIDASSGHIAKEKLEISHLNKKDKDTTLKNEENKKYLNFFIGLFLIALIFYILRKVKSE